MSASSATRAEAAAELGRLLSGTEAREVADRLSAGATMTIALRVVVPDRRAEVRSLLAGLGESALLVLRAVEGARSTITAIKPLWTLPGHLAQTGPLTSSVPHLVDSARVSVICSTFNFQRSSGLWMALERVAKRPDVVVRVYIDTDAATASSPSTADVAEHLRPATVLRTCMFEGVRPRNHAKFLAIDHRFLLVTSANFSWSAEHANVEFGVLIDNPSLTASVELELRRAEGLIYEPV